MSPEEREACLAFEASQQRRNRIGAVIGVTVILGFGAMRLYQGYLRSEARKPLVIETRSPLPSQGPSRFELEVQAERARLAKELERKRRLVEILERQRREPDARDDSQQR